MQNKGKLKLVFAGTPAFGLPALDALLETEHVIQAIYTQPDRPVGRGKQVQFSPVKQWALSHQLPVIQPEHFKSEDVMQALAALKPDLMVVIAYGLILPRAVLQIPRLGCINVHASLLPAWRGASPIQSAILHGDAETGVTIMQMAAGMDTGDILETCHTPITSTDTALSLHDRLAQLAVPALLKVITALAQGQANPVPQVDADATYAKKIDKADARIDWSKPAATLVREIRAYYPWPVSFVEVGELRMRVIEASAEKTPCKDAPGTILKLDATGMYVATGEGVLVIRQFQFAGGKVMPVSSWLHAKKPFLSVGQSLK